MSLTSPALADGFFTISATWEALKLTQEIFESQLKSSPGSTWFVPVCWSCLCFYRSGQPEAPENAAPQAAEWSRPAGELWACNRQQESCEPATVGQSPRYKDSFLPTACQPCLHIGSSFSPLSQAWLGSPNPDFFEDWLIDWLIWLWRVFLAIQGLSLVVVSGGYASFQCTRFSLQWLLLLQGMGSNCTVFSSWGTQA